MAELEHLVELKDCAYVTIRGFTLECSNGTAVVLQDCTNCLVAGNTIRNVGDHNGCGVKIEGGRENGIAGNDISDVGSDGVHVAAGDAISLTRSEVRVDNNYIHHAGHPLRTGAVVSRTEIGPNLIPNPDLEEGQIGGSPKH